jgi:hypothetical protein
VVRNFRNQGKHGVEIWVTWGNTTPRRSVSLANGTVGTQEC